MFFLAALPAPESASAVGWLLLSFAALAAAVNQVLSILDRFKENPPAHLQYATKAELREVHGRIKREREEVNAVIAAWADQQGDIREEITKRFEQLDGKRSASIAGLHTALHNTTESIRTEIKDDMGKVHNRINDVFGEMKRILGLLKQ